MEERDPPEAWRRCRWRAVSAREAEKTSLGACLGAGDERGENSSLVPRFLRQKGRQGEKLL